MYSNCLVFISFAGTMELEGIFAEVLNTCIIMLLTIL